MSSGRPPGVIIAGVRSGSGKTTLTMGVLRALRRRGLAVASAKCGPDYIDPGMHGLATARPSVNLDTWAMRTSLVDALRSALEQDADVVVCEGVMGLFDGIESEPGFGDGSTASVAAHTGWPVVLILDVSGQTQSVAAVAKGFSLFRPDVRVVGVILNRVTSPRHLALCRKGLDCTGIAVLGAVPSHAKVQLADRHLGLVQAQETLEPEALLEELARLVEAHVDLDRLLQLAAIGNGVPTADVARLIVPGQRIAVGSDVAFSFMYQHLMRGWYAAGAELLPFSPLENEPPSERADVCWLPGGYPELHAGRLASNWRFMSGLRAFAKKNPVHGECGGYMVLGTSLVDEHGVDHPMAGLLGHRTRFCQRRLKIGYRAARLAAASVIGSAGTWCRGHEFHYGSILGPKSDEPLFDAVRGGQDVCSGSRRGRVTGTFFHLIDAVT